MNKRPRAKWRRRQRRGAGPILYNTFRFFSSKNDYILLSTGHRCA